MPIPEDHLHVRKPSGRACLLCLVPHIHASLDPQGGFVTRWEGPRRHSADAMVFGNICVDLIYAAFLYLTAIFLQ